MYTSGSIIMMIMLIAIISAIVYGILLVVKISGVKVMLLGIALIVFSNSVLKGMTTSDPDVIISVIGLSLCFAGFFLQKIIFFWCIQSYHIVN